MYNNHTKHSAKYNLFQKYTKLSQFKGAFIKKYVASDFLTANINITKINQIWMAESATRSRPLKMRVSVTFFYISRWEAIHQTNEFMDFPLPFSFTPTDTEQLNEKTWIFAAFPANIHVFIVPY